MNRPPIYAANFTGTVRVSRLSTTLSTVGGWYKAMAYSGDGINGDAEAGNFNPIHPGGTTDGSAGGLAVGYVVQAATTTYAAAQYVGFKPDQTGNLDGVMLVVENLTSTSLANTDIVLELLQFPSASCTTSCSNYVTGTQGAYTYPTDTVVLRRTVWQHNLALSGENIQPGNHGRATFDFRFDPPVAVTAGGGVGNHYGLRIINMGASAPVFGTWAQAPQASGFPTINGTIRTIGVRDIDNSTATTMIMPEVLTGNITLTTSPMVAGNTSAGIGMATVRRTENEHWTATYSNANSNWTLTGSISGTQANKLTTATNGGTGASWLNDGVTFAPLTTDITGTTNKICVASTAGFAANQYIDVWDSDTASAQFTILSINAADGSCSPNNPYITTTANLTNVNNYTQSKNATVAKATWKQRIVQGAIQAFSQDMPTTTKICVADSSRFSAPTAGTAVNVVVWDDDTTTIGTNRVVSTSQADGSCTSNNSITVFTAITASTYTTAKNAYVAEFSANLSNINSPANGAVMRWTAFNHSQNPSGSTLLARTTSVALAYARLEALATANTRYPFLSNRHLFFVAYGDANTAAPADGDIIIVGNGKADPDTGDTTVLSNDVNWASKQSHVVTIDRSWDAPMAYTGFNGGAINDGAGSRTNFSGWSQNGGWVSALVSPGSQLGIANTPNAHFRINIPGKIVVDSDASVAFGTSANPIPSSSMHDVYFNTVDPPASTLLTGDAAGNATTINVASTTGFLPGDTIVLDDANSIPTARVIAAVESATQLTLVAGGAATPTYTVIGQNAFIAKGPTTELPTGQDRKAGVYNMTGVVTATQSNLRTGRVSLYASGSAQFRTPQSALAVDIDGNINTGFLGNNLTDSGDTWMDVKDNVVGNWQPLDKLAVAGGTNQLADNIFSSTGMAGTDDVNQMPLWTGAVTKTDANAGGRTSLPTPNMEVAEIGTIPLTDIYNADFGVGATVFSANYNNATGWTLFSDGANTEVNDAIYFGDQGDNMIYALEFNLGQAMVASANLVWEYYKTGVGWTQFTPRDAYQYQARSGVTLPLSADTVVNSLTVTLGEGASVFGLDQVVMIDDNDSSPIYRRLGTAAPTSTTLTFTEPVPAGYTTAQSATVTRLNGGQWESMDPTTILTSGTGRRILSWTPSDLGGSAEKTTINGVNAYWVRARLSSFTSWTTSPTNQTTPVAMGGLERLPSSVMNVVSGSQEAKISNLSVGVSFNPNETYILEYGNSPGWTQLVPLLPAAPYTWHINNGTLSQNTATTDFHVANGDLSWSNYTVTAKVQMRTANDATSRKIGVVLRGNLDGSGYGALIEKTNAQQRIGIYPMALGAEGAVFANFTKAFSENSWFWIKTSVLGVGDSTTINAKFWADGSGEPGSWDVTYTTNAAQGLWSTGRVGLFADAMIADFDDVSVDNGSVVLSDAFTNTGTWKLRGSINGALGTITPGTPFSSNYLNLTLKHKGGWNGMVLPENGDKIYMSATSTRSYKGLSGTGPAAMTTSDSNTVYENVDFEWNPASSSYTATGSATGAMGNATPGSPYLATGSKLGLTIPSGTPTATRFGNRMLLLQNNLRRNTGSWIGNNGYGSAVLVWPTYTLTSSAITPRYNIEGINGTATARQHGTIDFWFKTNYNGTPPASTSPKGMYLFDYANQGNTDRLFIRHTNDGYLEAAVFAGTAQGTLLRKSFSATAGEWHHFRLVWDEAQSKKWAYLDGAIFTSGQGSAVGTRGANAGIIRIGNAWTYDAAFDGAIDEFTIFDDAIDTSGGCDWTGFTVPSSAWTNGQTTGCDDADSNIGTNIFRASFDQAMNPQEGSIMADYAVGIPSMIFTNGADTGNERIRVVTYPARTRVWIDNTGEKYTPSARIKFGSGFLENAAIATLAGWSHNFTFHHKAASQSTISPTFSPVLNLQRSTHFWSDEPFSWNGSTMGAPINAGMGFGMGTIGLSGLATIEVSDVSMENQYTNFAVLTNPFTSLATKPAQRFANSVFYNFYDRAYTVAGKTQGTNYVGADFVTTHFAAANIGSGYNAGTSQNVGLDGSIFMGIRNSYVTVPPAAAGGAATFYSGRLFTINNTGFYNNGITGAGTSGALNLGTGVAKVDVTNNIFSINSQGVRLFGNAFINMANNVFDGQVSDDITTVGTNYGSGIRAAASYSSVAITDTDSVFGRGLWNEADISLPPNTATFEAESLLQFTGEGTQFRSPILFGTADYLNMNRIGDEYLSKTIPGTDIRGTYSTNEKDIVNLTTSGLMRTTGPNLTDRTVRTEGGYGWRLEPTDPDVPLDYTIKVVGVANKPLAVTGYLRLNSNYGTTNLPTVTLSGLGMTGVNLTWTAAATNDTWQQFVVSGTPNESALAVLKISGKLGYVVSDSGTSEIISNATGNYLPVLVEDNDKSWTDNQWVGYKFRDPNGKTFEIVKNTSKILYLKGVITPNLLSTTFAATATGDYVIYNEPYFYIDDVSVLSGTVDTGTLDFHSSGQPVSPWLATGLTAESIWNAQYSTFSNSTGSIGQLLGDALVASYADVSDLTTSTTEFDTTLSSSTDDFYNNGVIIFTEGTNKGLVRRISDYVGLNKTVTIDPALPVAPASGDRFAILAATANSAGGGGASAADIWSYTLRQLTTEALSGGGSLATAADVANIRSDIAAVMTELGTGNISAIRTSTNSINWSDVTGLVTNTGLIKAKTDNIDWTDIATIKTKTNSINWSDVTAIKFVTDTIVWGDITTIKSNVATLITEIGTNNISAIKTATDFIDWNDISGLITTSGQIKAKTDDIVWADVTGIKLKTDDILWTDITAIKNNVATLITEIGVGNITAIKTDTDTINWTDVSGLVTTSGQIKAKTDDIVWADVTGIKTNTDTIDWADVTGIQAKTDTIDWANVTGIKAKTDTIAWGDIANLQTSINSLSSISAADVWSYANRTITGDVTLSSASTTAIWNSACAILNTSGSVGKKVCDNLDAAVSTRSTLTAAQVWAEAGRTITGLENPALASIANNVWSNATRALTDYGNDITAQEVWNVLTSSLTTIDSIGKLLVTNVDDTISSKATQTSVNIVGQSVSAVNQNVSTVNQNVTTLSQNVATTSALVDASITSRASQASLNAHEASEAAFRVSTTATLGALTLNVATIMNQISTIETKIDNLSNQLSGLEHKIDTVDTNLDSVKLTVEDTNTKVTAMQTVTNNILAKWGSYDASTIIGYVDTLESYLGEPGDLGTTATVFGKLNYVKTNSGSSGSGSGSSSGGTIDLIYAQVQATHSKLLDVQTELGYAGKSATAYEDMLAIKNYVDSVETSLSTLDTRTSAIATSVTNISSELKTVTANIGKVNVDSFSQIFEVKATDVTYLKNKVIELKAMADINRQLLEKVSNQPVVKVVMEWGSVIIKFVIVNPSDSTNQKIPFKAFLPKEVKQEYIIDLGGLSLNYDTTTEQYYVTADITLEKGESITRNVEIKDIWIVSEDEVASLRKQADEMASGLNKTSYNAQALTLKTDINTRLDKVVRKQKDNNATPQDHILAYRENVEDMKAVNDNLKGMKDLVLNSGASNNFLASIGGIQAFATWGIVLALIFGMGTLGMFYYQLWRRRVVNVTSETSTKSKAVELPTPMPHQLPGFKFTWLKHIFIGWLMLLKGIANVFGYSIKVVIPQGKMALAKITVLPKRSLVIALIIGAVITVSIGGISIYRHMSNKQSPKNQTDEASALSGPTPVVSKDEKVQALVNEMVKDAAKKKQTNDSLKELIDKTTTKIPATSPTPIMIQLKDITDVVNAREKSEITSPVVAKIKANSQYPLISEVGDWYQIDVDIDHRGWVNKQFVKKVEATETDSTDPVSQVLGVTTGYNQLIIVRQTPTGWLNVRRTPSTSAEVVTKIYPGDSYPFSEVKGGWYKILLKDLTEGWVSKEYVKVIPMSDSQKQLIELIPPNGSGINIREAPNTDSKIIKSLYSKSRYQFLGEQNDWVRVGLLDTKEGWVLKKYTQLVAN